MDYIAGLWIFCVMSSSQDLSMCKLFVTSNQKAAYIPVLELYYDEYENKRWGMNFHETATHSQN